MNKFRTLLALGVVNAQGLYEETSATQGDEEPVLAESFEPVGAADFDYEIEDTTFGDFDETSDSPLRQLSHDSYSSYTGYSSYSSYSPSYYSYYSGYSSYYYSPSYYSYYSGYGGYGGYDGYYYDSYNYGGYSGYGAYDNYYGEQWDEGYYEDDDEYDWTLIEDITGEELS